MPRLRDRPIGDVIVLLVALTVCASVLLAGAGITYVRIVQPDRDLSTATAALVGTVNTLLGVMVGYLAGRTGTAPRPGPDA